MFMCEYVCVVVPVEAGYGRDAFCAIVMVFSCD